MATTTQTMPPRDGMRLVELRSYALKRGRGRTFDALMSQRAVPMLRQAGLDVVAHGVSVGTDDHYYLMRCFDDLDHRQAQEDAFYASAAWRGGPRAEVLDCIDTYVDALLWLDEACVEGLRASLAR